MTEEAGVSDRYPTASPWPMFVALGFALVELGLFLGIFPVSVGGVLLFGGSVAGILTESEYVAHLWKTMAGLGVAFGLLGVAMVVFGDGLAVGPALEAIDAPNVVGNRLTSRGLAIGAAGVILVATSVTGELMEPAR